MEPTSTLTDQIREWYAHSPTAQRAYARLRADLDTVCEQAKPKLDEFWAQVGPIIDPPAAPQAKDASGDDHGHERTGGATSV